MTGAGARLAIVLALLATGCAGELRRREAALATRLDQARRAGARRCAPVLLATAEAHHEFVDLELDEGNPIRAREELALAEASAARALVRARAGCSARDPDAPDRDEDGVPDGVDRCPDQAEDADGHDDADGCPDGDNDGDGVPDARDRCPRAAEDKDRHDDEDGCPDDDNDGDGLSDRVDQCPDEAEDLDGKDDDDGCADCDDDGDGAAECPAPGVDKCPGRPARTPDGCPPQGVVIGAEKLDLAEAIAFEPGRATIARGSLALLGQVADALRANPTLRIRVEGHTDGKGAAGANLRLSRRRAAAVRTFLIGTGVAGSRIVAKGYGESRPVADDRTEDGRAENRRVDFVITQR